MKGEALNVLKLSVSWNSIDVMETPIIESKAYEQLVEKGWQRSRKAKRKLVKRSLHNVSHQEIRSVCKAGMCSPAPPPPPRGKEGRKATCFQRSNFWERATSLPLLC